MAELASIATQVGPNTGSWPGLTIYRFTASAGPTWEEIQSLSLCVVAQGRKAVTVGGETYMYDPFPLGCVDDFRVDRQWIPAWRPADITDSGREQLRAIGFTV